jgi:sugar transferase (PEP-CTERM/EpsH1 system associated)
MASAATRPRGRDPGQPRKHFAPAEKATILRRHLIEPIDRIFCSRRLKAMRLRKKSIVRVVHVTFGLDVGGQEKLLLELARHCDPTRLTLTFVSLGHRGVLAGDLEACGAAVVALGQPVGLKPGLIWLLARLFRRIKPDVVHTHDQRALFYATLAARLAGVPRVVHTRHGRDIHATPRQLAMVRFVSRLVNDFVCVSSDVAALSLAQGIAPGRLQTIVNGIDGERFPFSGPRTGGPLVAVVRLSPEKDVANLVRAVAIAGGEDPDLRVEVAGDGPCRSELRQLVGELGLEERVSFLGEVRDVPGLLARAAIFVLPSRSEGISLTLLEAMACGLPVVATRVGGTPEVVRDGQDGLLVPPSNPAALAAAILRLRRDPEGARRMGEAGRRRVELDFGARRMVADYLALYLEGGDPGPRASSPARRGALVGQSRASADIKE